MGTGGAVMPGDCCDPHGGKGCGEPSVSSCVCGLDPYCCNTSWDQICVNEATGLCGASCEMGSGGSPGTGGAGPQCDVVFPDACGGCLCNDCFDPLAACIADDSLGCLAIFGCVQSTGCSGAGCYQNSTCRPLIDALGGLTGPSMTKALELASCGAMNSCPCD